MFIINLLQLEKDHRGGLCVGKQSQNVTKMSLKYFSRSDVCGVGVFGVGGVDPSIKLRWQ